MNPQELLKKSTIRVPFKELNSSLQQVIALSEVIVYDAPDQVQIFHRPSIAEARFHRKNNELLMLTNVGGGFLSGKVHMIPASLVFGLFFGRAAARRHLWVSSIQNAHEALVHRMAKHGIIQTEFEGRYPKDWINPTIVSRTHPVFDVENNGDIIFRKVTRREYLQYLMQKKWVGNYGVNTWQWRGYLAPPRAPEPVKKWAQAKLKKMLERIPRPSWRPQPVPGFGRVQARAKKTSRFRTVREKRRH